MRYRATCSGGVILDAGRCLSISCFLLDNVVMNSFIGTRFTSLRISQFKCLVDCLGLNMIFVTVMRLFCCSRYLRQYNTYYGSVYISCFNLFSRLCYITRLWTGFVAQQSCFLVYQYRAHSHMRLLP